MRLAGRTGSLAVLVALLRAGCFGSPRHGAGAQASPSPTDQGVAEIGFVGDGLLPRGSTDYTGLTWTPLDPHAAYLFGPHYSLALGGQATTDELSSSQLSALTLFVLDLPRGQPLRAAPGAELLVVHGGDSGLPLSQYLSGAVDSMVVKADGKELAQVRPQSFQTASMVLVVCVPKGSAVQLAVTDGGRTQSIDLRTGATSDVEPLLHPPLSKTDTVRDIIHVSSPSGITPAGKGMYSQVTVAAELMPWLPDKGWAPSGRAWLRISLYPELEIIADVDLALDLARSLTLRTGDGQALPFPGTAHALAADHTGGDPVRQVYDVPASTRVVVAGFASHGTLTANGKRATWQRYPDPESGARIELAGPRM